MESEFMFKALLKAYTGEWLHDYFAIKMIARNYDDLQIYLMRYIQCLNRHSFRFSYQTFHEPLYRAVCPEEGFDPKKYPINSVRMWPLF